ncbi:acyl-CoA dehydrogenase family protein [Dermatobacter hominis]|uniref:acyl-CoA dehydrogenase family protein n=1 Tax=Dermatobacter hominis TaxID=2884263 RepID=UPI001D127640|nr:acyl-CoA dehydrogenase family protein [Dermatobacter hominis]UDY35042.1 acyl-CoA dehydrogenase family protein [Dermatobacter hominis]
MRLRFDDAVEAFRAELLEWLAANRPDPEEMAAEPSLSTGHAPGWARRWTRAMFDAGWLVPGWPPELGGRGASPIETLVYLEELARARVPRTTNVQGLGIVVPTIVEHGNPEQVRDHALPILRGESTACLGMSEPGAGSDLAGLSTRAVLDGDHWVIDGQKVWTSGANYADTCLLFCRTDPDAPKHEGISILIVPMGSPGITVRPLPEIIRPEAPDLNEVHLDAVRVPAGNLVGTLHDGWAMANASLAHERGMVWVSAVMGLEESLERLRGEAPELLAPLGPQERALAVDQIVQVAIDAQAARCMGYRGFGRLARGGTAPEQALMKLYASESRQRIARVAAELQGANALEVDRVANDGHLAVDEPQGTWLEQYFNSFANTISAGTSEIQRNIIAERVLGLPRG